MRRQFLKSVMLIILGLPCSVATAQEAAPAPAPQPTLWKFLGNPVQKARGALTNRRGNFPGLERKPALKSLADPANLASENPAIKAAAEIKKAEDMKKQKIKAIKYLTSIGCGCYDKDGVITEALVAAAGDCTEDVRLATVEAIKKAARNSCCAQCGSTCCCNEDVVKKLAEMAYEKGEDGCYLEPSSRVRQAAKEALRVCCPGQGPVIMDIETEPEPLPSPKPDRPEGPRREGPSEEELEAEEEMEVRADEVTKTDLAPVARPYVMPVDPYPPIRQPGAPGIAPVVTALEPLSQRAREVPRQRRDSTQPSQLNDHHTALPSVSSSPEATVPHEGRGVVIRMVPKAGLAHVHFADRDRRLAAGTRLTVYRSKGDYYHAVGQVRIEKSNDGSSDVRPIAGTRIHHLRSGDVVAISNTQLASRN